MVENWIICLKINKMWKMPKYTKSNAPVCRSCAWNAKKNLEGARLSDPVWFSGFQVNWWWECYYQRSCMLFSHVWACCRIVPGMPCASAGALTEPWIWYNNSCYLSWDWDFLLNREVILCNLLMNTKSHRQICIAVGYLVDGGEREGRGINCEFLNNDSPKW